MYYLCDFDDDDVMMVVGVKEKKGVLRGPVYLYTTGSYNNKTDAFIVFVTPFSRTYRRLVETQGGKSVYNEP